MGKKQHKHDRLLKKSIKQRKEQFRKPVRENITHRVHEGTLEDSEYRKFETTSKRDTYLEELEKKKGEFRFFIDKDKEADFSGMVVELYPRGALVRSSKEKKDVLCEIAEFLWAKNESPVAAGDEVEGMFVKESNYDYEGIIIGVKKRKSIVSIPDMNTLRSGRIYEKILAANIDLFIVVDSIRSPDLQLSFVDRCLIIGQREDDKEIVLCINKIDLFRDIPEEVMEYEQYVGRLILTSAKTGEGVDVLAEFIKGKRAIMTGRSGVGKSSLLNTLCPGLDLEAKPVIKKSGKGVHTTGRYSLYELPNGGMVIDTPGIKEIGIVNIDKPELTWYFPEFIPFRDNCRFSDCTHTHEPVCAIKKAVQEGEISRFRYERYVKILDSIENGKPY